MLRDTRTAVSLSRNMKHHSSLHRSPVTGWSEKAAQLSRIMGCWIVENKSHINANHIKKQCVAYGMHHVLCTGFFLYSCVQLKMIINIIMSLFIKRWIQRTHHWSASVFRIRCIHWGWSIPRPTYFNWKHIAIKKTYFILETPFSNTSNLKFSWIDSKMQ